MMIYHWTTKTPTTPGQYWAMMGGCVLVAVTVDHEYEPRCVEDVSIENNPLFCWWKGQVNGPEKLTEHTAICWTVDREPLIPKRYWDEWRYRKPKSTEFAEINTRTGELTEDY